jgi:hypothetical protein
MPEKETIFSSKVKYNGIFSFKDFYMFCYQWLTEETELDLMEKSYKEKIEGNAKRVQIEWEGEKKVTDYFRFDANIKFVASHLQEVEINQGGAKVKTNKGEIEINIKGILVRDYEGKFETTAFKKFLRSIYEKWVIPSRIEEFKSKISSESDEFLNQAKAYLDLEGKKG